MTPLDYLERVLLELTTHALISEFDLIESWLRADSGYIRIRATLTNGDLLELAEYFTFADDELQTTRYRYQWMDDTGQIVRRRWDNAPHHPGLSGFPHHMHTGDQSVEPGHSLTILDVLSFLSKVDFGAP